MSANDCWTLAMQQIESSSHTTGAQNPSIGHRNVCVSCGRSLLRARSHQLRNNTERESHIYNVISFWIQPQQVRGSSSICHPCWQRADRTRLEPWQLIQLAQPEQAVEPAVPAMPPQPEVPVQIEQPALPVQSDLVVLLNYKRAADTETHCFITGCQGQERHRMPLSLRVLLLRNFNYYIPMNCRACVVHWRNTEWDFLNENLQSNNNNAFTAAHIEDMLNLAKTSEKVIDFEKINEIPDHLVHYWLGRTKAQYNEILSEVPRLAEMRRGPIALAAYLIKLRTGDSNESIGSLLQLDQHKQ